MWTFVNEVMSLLFNMLYRFVIPFLPRSKRLLISCLQPPFAVILELPKTKSVTVSIVSSPLNLVLFKKGPYGPRYGISSIHVRM